MNDPCVLHLKFAMHNCRYIRGIVDFGMYYSHVGKMELIGFSDSNWGNNLYDRKSTLGNHFALGSRLITWS